MGFPDPDQIEEEGLTVNDIVEGYPGPGDEGTTEVIVPPEWEDEEIPYDDYELVENGGGRHLELHYRDFEIVMWNESFGHWAATIDVPGDVAGYITGPGGRGHFIKARFPVTSGDHYVGYVDEVDGGDSHTGPITVKIATTTNFQPGFEVRHFIDRMVEYAGEAKEFMEKREEAFSLAAENGD